MNHGSLFSGIGGFDLAAEWAGWNNIFHCEKEKFCQKILKYYWPDAELHEDITTTDFKKYKDKIDILSGGFPCQPFSSAGKRKGTADDRHLWPAMLRAISEIKPRWVVGENVFGLVNWNAGLVLDTIKTGLENLQYEVFPPVIIPACGINAPHRRYRVWIIARCNDTDANSERQSNRDGAKSGQLQDIKEGFQDNGEISRSISQQYAADAKNAGLEGGGIRGLSTEETHARSTGFGTARAITDTGCSRQQGQGRAVKPGHTKTFGNGQATWSYNDDRWPLESAFCPGNDGLSSRLDRITFSKWRQESIKGAGNAIVPQIAFEIFKTIEKFEAQCS